MAAYVLANLKVEDQVAYEEYKRVVPPLIERYRGRYLVRGGRAEVLEGEEEAGRLIVLEFETAEDARRWYSSPQYEEAKALRQRAATGWVMLVEGVETS